MMTYKSEAEITAAFINDGWSKNTAFTELHLMMHVRLENILLISCLKEQNFSG